MAQACGISVLAISYLCWCGRHIFADVHGIWSRLPLLEALACRRHHGEVRPTRIWPSREGTFANVARRRLCCNNPRQMPACFRMLAHAQVVPRSQSQALRSKFGRGRMRRPSQRRTSCSEFETNISLLRACGRYQQGKRQSNVPRRADLLEDRSSRPPGDTVCALLPERAKSSAMRDARPPSPLSEKRMIDCTLGFEACPFSPLSRNGRGASPVRPVAAMGSWVLRFESRKNSMEKSEQVDSGSITTYTCRKTMTCCALWAAGICFDERVTHFLKTCAVIDHREGRPSFLLLFSWCACLPHLFPVLQATCSRDRGEAIEAYAYRSAQQTGSPFVERLWAGSRRLCRWGLVLPRLMTSGDHTKG